MKSFENIDAKSVKQAVNLLQRFHQEKKSAHGRWRRQRDLAAHEGTSDRRRSTWSILKTVPGLSGIKEERGGFRIGALTTLVKSKSIRR